MVDPFALIKWTFRNKLHKAIAICVSFVIIGILLFARLFDGGKWRTLIEVGVGIVFVITLTNLWINGAFDGR